MMMKSVIVMTMMASLAGSVSALQKMDREFEAQGEIVEVSTKPATVTLEESANPVDQSSPGAKQSGVVRKFVVNEATKLSSRGEPIELADVHPGARATIHYVIDSGKNVAKSIELGTPATE